MSFPSNFRDDMEDVTQPQALLSQLEMEAELEKLRFRETLFEATEHLGQIGHYEWDNQQDRLGSCSDEYARIYNMTVEQVLACQDSVASIERLIHPDDFEQFKLESKVLEYSNSIDLKFRLLFDDGEIKYIRKIGVAIDVTDSGKRSFGILQDITELVKHERELEYKDALANQAEEITDIGHFVYDEVKQQYLVVSKGLAQIHGLQAEDIIDRVVSISGDLDLLHPDDRERVGEVYDDYLKNGDEWQVEYRLIRADGQLRWVREMGKTHVRKNGRVEQTIGVLQDITDQKNNEKSIIEANANLEQQVAERTRELANSVKLLQEEIVERSKIAAELDFLANHDALTGLPSLRLCKDRLDRSIAEARRNRDMSAVMFLDLDGFKATNDCFGHEFGDMVLKVTANRIKAVIRETDTVARIGGDEFLIILSSLPELMVARRIATTLIDQISQPISIEQKDIVIGVSIGIALYPDDGTTSEGLIRQADKAMYLVKKSGKNNFGFTASPTPQLESPTATNTSVVNAIMRNLKN